MIFVNDRCYWCEMPIFKTAPNTDWIHDSALGRFETCSFHPIAFDIVKHSQTGQKAPHQTEQEVHLIIKSDYFRNKHKQNQPLRKVDDNVIMLRNNAKSTSRKAAEKVLPKTGSIRRAVFDFIIANGGATDYQLEAYLNGKHQTISASRRSLVVDGLLVDSGRTVKNAAGNDCIVWVTASMLQGQLALNV